MAMIQAGGYIEQNGVKHGLGLSQHYENMRQIIWPELDAHRWHNLIRDSMVSNKCTVLAGCGSSGKSHEAAWFYLCDYFVFPETTCILVSSTDMRGLRGRIWSEITSLFQRAKDRFPDLPGYLLDSRVAILTDSLDEDTYDRKARDYRKCIQGVPCRNSSGGWMGINRYAGWKQKRMRLLADESAQMEREFLTGITNLNSNPDFKCCIMGNFSDPQDCLGRAAEPRDGWGGHMEPKTTEIWETFYPLKGVCVNLIGFDSPNHDFPKQTPDDPDRYPYMIGPKRIQEIKDSFGETSAEFMSQCWGAMKISTLSNKVLNRKIVEEGKAFEDCIWLGNAKPVKIASLDAAWGGDRTVFRWGEFALDVDGKTLLRMNPPELVPLEDQKGLEADYAIAQWVMARCQAIGVEPDNFFHDSTGRGTLGTILGRVWSTECNPVEFGGQPSKRPVSNDFYWNHPDTGFRQLKLASEHYVKFVSELWYSFRYTVESGQIRNLDQPTADEFFQRIWRRVRDEKIEVEPKTGTREKPGMKQRTGKSPDLADAAVLLLEGARRRGFQISKLADSQPNKSRKPDWLAKEAREYEQFRQNRMAMVK
jgi:hypothetical protein